VLDVHDRLDGRCFGRGVRRLLVFILRGACDRADSAHRGSNESDRGKSLPNDILGPAPTRTYLRDARTIRDSWSTARQGRLHRACDGKSSSRTSRFIDDAHVLRIIDRIVSNVGRADRRAPRMVRRPTSGRQAGYNAIIRPLSLGGPELTISKFSRRSYTMDDLAFFGALDQQAATFPRRFCVRGQVNI